MMYLIQSGALPKGPLQIMELMEMYERYDSYFDEPVDEEYYERKKSLCELYDLIEGRLFLFLKKPTPKELRLQD